jgi:hypothetical protein
METNLMQTTDVVRLAREHWRSGNALEAGRLIFESLPNDVRPQWAGRVLRLVLRRTGIKSEPIERIIGLVDNPVDWSQAHDAFSAARDVVLQLERLAFRDPQQSMLLSHLLLAELVAKVTYNATNPYDEFDEDSGWWIAPCLEEILNKVGDQDFSESMWQALSALPGSDST